MNADATGAHRWIGRLALAVVLLGVTWSPRLSDAVLAKGGHHGVTPQVINGYQVQPGEDRFMAALLHKNKPGNVFDQQYCDATVIAPEWVLTAAHCAQGEDPAQLAVFLGQVDLTQPGTTIAVSRVVINPTYDPRHTANDAALVQLRQAIPEAVYAPIALVGAGDAAHDAPGSPVSVAGWGATKAKPPYAYPSGLRQADIQIQSDAVCGGRQAYGKAFRAASMLCAGTNQTPVKDACYGDSGGPLFAQTTAGPLEVAIVSWGRSCAQLGYPGIYTRLSDPAIAAWIQRVLTDGQGGTAASNGGTAPGASHTRKRQPGQTHHRHGSGQAVSSDLPSPNGDAALGRAHAPKHQPGQTHHRPGGNQTPSSDGAAAKPASAHHAQTKPARARKRGAT